MDIGPEETSEFTTPEHRKRNRIRLSCTTCREKKLKCNRQTPCDQCEKRGIVATCEYVPYTVPRAGVSGFPTVPDTVLSAPATSVQKQSLGEPSLQARLRHLEHLVQVLKSQRRDNLEANSSANSNPLNAEPAEDDEPPLECKSLNETAGHMVDESRYVHSTNWEAILDDITLLTNDLKPFYSDPVTELDVGKRGPILLVGSFPSVTIADMLGHLPPHSVMDRIIARFFQGKEPAWTMFHVQSFLRNYGKFWENPDQATFTWLGLLFAMTCHTALFCLRGDEEVPGNLGDPLHVFDTYRARVAHCLALDDYTKPGQYKVETLMLYFGTEYLREPDAMLGTSVLLSIICRLAMHMGLHRDSRHYPDISPFEGEMRRRIWTLLVGIDHLVSFQFGLPSNINARFYDTAPPRNLRDEDFDEDSKILPPARPETERTLVLYLIVKDRLFNAFSDIMCAISSRVPVKYAEIMQLDEQLEKIHKEMPAHLQYRPFSESLVDPIDLIMQRLWLELLYQKTRSILHRKYLGLSRMSSRYSHSRLACLDAATKTLRHQYDIHCEIQPGGRLAKERWFVSSVSTHDFLLANMILCLELSYLYAQSSNPDSSKHAIKAFKEDTSQPVIPTEQLLEVLRTSRSIWQTTRKESSEANRAFKILTKMLSMSTGVAFESSPESVDSVLERMDAMYPPPLPFGVALGSDRNRSSNLTPQSTTPAPATSSSAWGPASGSADALAAASSWMPDLPVLGPAEALSSLENMDALVDPNLANDWSLWDNQIQNPSADMLEIDWHTFFQRPPGM